MDSKKVAAKECTFLNVYQLLIRNGSDGIPYDRALHLTGYYRWSVADLLFSNMCNLRNKHHATLTFKQLYIKFDPKKKKTTVHNLYKHYGTLKFEFQRIRRRIVP